MKTLIAFFSSAILFAISINVAANQGYYIIDEREINRQLDYENAQRDYYHRQEALRKNGYAPIYVYAQPQHHKQHRRAQHSRYQYGHNGQCFVQTSHRGHYQWIPVRQRYCH